MGEKRSAEIVAKWTNEIKLKDCSRWGDSPFARLMQIFIIDRSSTAWPRFFRSLSPRSRNSTFTFVPVTPNYKNCYDSRCAGQVDGKLISIFDAVRKIYLWPGGCLAGWTLKLSDFPRRKNSNGLIASGVLCFPVRAHRIKKNQLGTKKVLLLTCSTHLHQTSSSQ